MHCNGEITFNSAHSSHGRASDAKSQRHSEDYEDDDDETESERYAMPASIFTLSRDGIFWSEEMEELYEGNKVYFDDEEEKEKLRFGRATEANTVGWKNVAKFEDFHHFLSEKLRSRSQLARPL